MINDDLPVGATPLTADDANGLLPKHIATRRQLDQFESRNIQQGLQWALKTKRKPADILSINFCLTLHKKMFNKSWAWAGQFRRYEVNIGNTPPEIVMVQLKDLCDDAQAWIEFSTYPMDEIAIRLHHRMVYIHPFPNGNGRHSRIMADLLLKALGQPLFTWGNKENLTLQSENRINYLAALRLADKGNLSTLLAYART